MSPRHAVGRGSWPDDGRREAQQWGQDQHSSRDRDRHRDRDRDRDRRGHDQDRDWRRGSGGGAHDGRREEGPGAGPDYKRPRTGAMGARALCCSIESVRPGEGARLGPTVRGAYVKQFDKVPTKSRGARGPENVYPRAWLEAELEKHPRQGLLSATSSQTAADQQAAAAQSGTAKFRIRQSDGTKWFRCTDEACEHASSAPGYMWAGGGWQPEANFAKNRIRGPRDAIRCATCVRRGVDPMAASLQPPTQEELNACGTNKLCTMCGQYFKDLP